MSSEPRVPEQTAIADTFIKCFLFNRRKTYHEMSAFFPTPMKCPQSFLHPEINFSFGSYTFYTVYNRHTMKCPEHVPIAMLWRTVLLGSYYTHEMPGAVPSNAMADSVARRPVWLLHPGYILISSYSNALADSVARLLHCDKSLGDFCAIPRSAAETKWYITEVF